MKRYRIDQLIGFNLLTQLYLKFPEVGYRVEQQIWIQVGRQMEEITILIGGN